MDVKVRDDMQTRAEASGDLTYAIGDVHGRSDLLRALLDLIERDAERRGKPATIVFTGDFVDRGPDSFGVVEQLIAGPRRPQDRFVCIRGNHDDMLARVVRGGEADGSWFWYLFEHTVKSYDTDIRSWQTSRRLRDHADFLLSLPLHHATADHLFVHAGVRPGIALDQQAERDLLWIRQEFLDHDGLLPWRVVHGHTIVGTAPVVRPHRVSIDTGAYRSGVLTAVVLDGGTTSFIQTDGTPDFRAIVNDELLRATISGRALEPDLDSFYRRYVKGEIADNAFALELGQRGLADTFADHVSVYREA